MTLNSCWLISKINVGSSLASPCPVSHSFSAIFSKSLITERAVSWWMISSHGSPPLPSSHPPPHPSAARVSGLSVDQRCPRSIVTSQDTDLPLSKPWIRERHWPGGGSSGGRAAKRYSGSVKLSQSRGEAGNMSPSEGQTGSSLEEQEGQICFSYCRTLLESVRLLRDSVPLDGDLVSESLSSSRPPSVWSKETLSRALLRRCISSSPWGDEKLLAAMVERTSALCLLRLSSIPSRRPLWSEERKHGSLNQSACNHSSRSGSKYQVLCADKALGFTTVLLPAARQVCRGAGRITCSKLNV